MRRTRLLMSASALFMAALGLIASFVPDEVLRALAAPDSPVLSVLVQITGALYVGFAFLNWMTRGNLIGGIYSRPVAIANLVHFVSAGLAIIKFLADPPQLVVLRVLAVPYAVFAVSFGLILFRHPVRDRPQA